MTRVLFVSFIYNVQPQLQHFCCAFVAGKKQDMQPHIILMMNKPITNPFTGAVETTCFASSDAGIHYAEIVLCNDDDELLLFTSFEAAKQYQDDNAIDGRVVPLPIY